MKKFIKMMLKKGTRAGCRRCNTEANGILQKGAKRILECTMYAFSAGLSTRWRTDMRLECVYQNRDMRRSFVDIESTL